MDVAFDVHFMDAGRVIGARSKDVGVEIDAALTFPLGERLGLTLAATHFRGGEFYREALGEAPRVTYAFASFDIRF